MLKEKEFQNLKEMFDYLNKNQIQYLILRNYEEFESENFLIDHPDIDILCSDREALIHCLSAFSRFDNEKDRIHRAVTVGGKQIPLDIRTVGDGYYDEEWEKEMLQNRTLYKNLCHVMSNEDYFYSLLYHALIQKNKISSDYVEKLKRMKKELGINFAVDNLSLLESYLENHRYFYTYPEYPGAIFNVEKINKNLLKPNIKKQIERFVFSIKKKVGGYFAR